MAAVTAAARWLRLDREVWARLATYGRVGSALLVALGAYVVLAFGRFGIQGVLEPKVPVRLILVGLYGWVWLAGASWGVARFAFGVTASPVTVFRLFGHAHMPLLAVAVTIQIASIMLQAFGIAAVVAAFALAWMLALLVVAARAAFGFDLGRAMLAVAGPFAVWVAVVVRWLETQLGHLL